MPSNTSFKRCKITDLKKKSSQSHFKEKLIQNCFIPDLSVSNLNHRQDGQTLLIPGLIGPT